MSIYGGFGYIFGYIFFILIPIRGVYLTVHQEHITTGKVLPSYYAKAAACYSSHFTAFIVACGDRSQ